MQWTKKNAQKNCVVVYNFKSCLVVSKIFSSSFFFFKQLEMHIKMSFWFGQWSKCCSITVDRSLSIFIELRYESSTNIEEPSSDVTWATYDHAPPYLPPGQLIKQKCHFYVDLFEFKEPQLLLHGSVTCRHVRSSLQKCNRTSLNMP